MIFLQPNANEIINNLIHKDGVSAYYYDVCTKYQNGYKQTFITTLQTLITKVGCVIAKVDRNYVYISQCSQSLNYLCYKVLDSNWLYDEFDKLNINMKGNFGKHDIIKLDIDLERAVATFNTLIELIADKYKLDSLRYLTIKKRNNQNNNVPKNYLDYYKSMYMPHIVNNSNMRQAVNSNPNETATTCDEKIKLSATLLKGDGRYTKGIFKKINMVNFRLQVVIDNPNNLKISNVVATFNCRNHSATKNISTENNSITDIDFETSKFSGNIKVTIVAVYKISLFKTKKISTTISKNF